MSTAVQLPLPGTEPDPNDKLGQIMALARKMEDLHLQQQEKIRELEVLSEEGKTIQEVLLPDLMSAVGLTELTLTSGRQIVIKPEVHTSITKANWEAAKQWLVANKMDAVIKAHCLVDAEKKESLQIMNIPFELKESIHPSTLKALVKEQLADNPRFPKELFSVFEKSMAMVREP